MEICIPVATPKVKSSFCSPDLTLGRIDHLYFGSVGQPLADWTDLNEWNTRLDNETEDDTTKIRFLSIIGSKPKPERGKIDYSQDRTLYTTPTHTLPFKVDETSQETYEFLQWLDENAAHQFAIWYPDQKHLYGSNNGITASMTFDHVIPENDEELSYFEGVIEWKGIHPDRIVNPLA